MVTAAIHRFVEQHAAARPAAPAVVEAARMLTYRELNQRANACARKLLMQGFRRGAHAVVRMEPCADLAVLLLAALKTGGSYTWIDARQADSPFPAGLSMSARGPSSPASYVTIDPATVLACDAQPSPNLPVLTRPSDVACVLHGRGGVPEVLVPHATITGMCSQAAASPAMWTGETGAFDLWIVLMTGGTLATTVEQPAVAA